MKHSDDKDPAWDLLGHARKVEPAGNFTQNVMREVRQLDRPRGGRRPVWSACRWAGALAAVIALVSGSLMLIPKADDMATGAPVDPAGVAAQAAASQEGQITIEEFAEELEELAYLDELMSVPDTSLLADEDPAALLF